MALSKIRNDSLEDTAVHGRRNLLINGAMQIRQRSDATGVTSSQYVNDRFQQILGTAGTWSVSRSTEAPAGFSNSMKLDCTTANASLSAGSVYLLGQKLEGQNLQHLGYGASGAKKLTLSFWVRSNKTGTYIIEYAQDGNSRTQSQSYTISSADTWEHKSITIDGDTAAGGALANDNSSELAVYWWVVAGSDYSSGTLNTSWSANVNANRAVGQVNLADSTSNEWYLTGVQLEVGEQATPFEYRSYAEELALCQRYCVKRYPGNNNIVAIGMAYGTSAAYCELVFPVEMRTTPTATFDTTSGYWEFRNRSTDRTNGGGDPSLAASSAFAGRIDMALNGTVTDGAAGWIEANNGSAYYQLDAEL